MKRSRFSEEQIIGILKEQEAGQKTADVCRRHGISEATFYSWKAKYGGLEVSEARQLKALEDENTRLKKLLAEAMLDNAILKDVAANIVEQDHRHIKRLVWPGLGFKSFHTARRTIAGMPANDMPAQATVIARLFNVAA